MTYFRCLFSRVSISPAIKLFGFSDSKKSAARKFAVEVVTITCVFVYNVLQWKYMKLKENIMDFLDKEQVIVVIVCGILIIIGISI